MVTLTLKNLTRLSDHSKSECDQIKFLSIKQNELSAYTTSTASLPWKGVKGMNFYTQCSLNDNEEKAE